MGMFHVEAMIDDNEGNEPFIEKVNELKAVQSEALTIGFKVASGDEHPPLVGFLLQITNSEGEVAAMWTHVPLAMMVKIMEAYVYADLAVKVEALGGSEAELQDVLNEEIIEESSVN